MLNLVLSLLCLSEHKVIVVGLDNAGKTTILYQLWVVKLASFLYTFCGPVTNTSGAKCHNCATVRWTRWCTPLLRLEATWRRSWWTTRISWCGILEDRSPFGRHGIHITQTQRWVQGPILLFPSIKKVLKTYFLKSTGHPSPERFIFAWIHCGDALVYICVYSDHFKPVLCWLNAFSIDALLDGPHISVSPAVRHRGGGQYRQRKDLRHQGGTV